MITDYVQRIERVDQLVRLKATGSPSDFAKRLQISESLLYRCIADMRQMGAPIAFCRHSNSYVYTEDVGFTLNFSQMAE